MNFLKRYKLLIIITIAALIAGAWLWRTMNNTEYKHMQNPNRSHPPMAITQNPRPFCIGRMVIDLPEGLYLDDPALAPYISGSLNWNLTDIKTRTGVSLEEFNTIVQNRWAEVQTYTHDRYDDAYVKPSQRHQVKEHGWILAFNHVEIESNVHRVNGQNVFDIKIYYDAEGYFWDKGTMFIYKDNGTNIVAEFTDLIQRTRYHDASQIPQEAGICLNGGFIQTHYLSASEFFGWRIELPSGLYLSLLTGNETKEMTLLEKRTREGRVKPSGSETRDGASAAYITYRAAHREDHLAADEWITAFAETWLDDEPRTYKTEVSATWDYIGSKPPNPTPYVDVRMGFITTSEHRPTPFGAYPKPAEGDGYPTEEEFMALWDAVASTIRFYPGALTPKPEEQKPEPPPMPNTSQIRRDQMALDDFLKNG